MSETASSIASTEGQWHCLRCKTVALVPLPSPESISFFECPSCQRQFAHQPGRSLCLRWRHPIGLTLYPAMFERDPVKAFRGWRIVSKGDRSDPKTKAMMDEIRLELDDPTQQVRDILDCRASEEDLREYLRLYIEGW